MKGLKLYFSFFILGSLINGILSIMLVYILDVNSKSSITIAGASIVGYTVKAFLFGLLLLLINRSDIFVTNRHKKLILWSPFISFVLWYVLIFVFQIERFASDVSFGYTARFPHFYIQLLSCLLTTTMIVNYLKRKDKSIQTYS